MSKQEPNKCDNLFNVPFIKIVEDQCLTDLLNGNLYMNTFSYFKNSELSMDSARYDKYECIASYHINSTVKFNAIIEGKEKPFVFKNAIVSKEISESDLDQLKLFSMVGLRLPCINCHANSYPFTVNKRFADLELDHQGNRSKNLKAVFFKNGTEILNRAKQAAREQNVNLRGDYVEYVSRKENQCKMGPLKKFNRYSYQSEYRLIAQHSGANPFILKIGDLSDIALVVDFDNFLKSPFTLSNQSASSDQIFI